LKHENAAKKNAKCRNLKWGMQQEKIRNAATIKGIAAIINEKCSNKYCEMQQLKRGNAARKNK